MAGYYTKCGKKFNKNTNAATTGYTCDTDEFGGLVEKCKTCRFSEIKKRANIQSMNAGQAVNRQIL